MRILRQKSLALLVALSGGGAVTASAAEAFQTKLVTGLDKIELYDAMKFHAGYLWVGKARGDGAQTVEIYDATGKKKNAIAIKTSPAQIYAYSKDSVIVMGKVGTPLVTGYQIIQVDATGKLKVTQKKDFPISIMALHYAGKVNGKHYFGAPGGDSAEDYPLNQNGVPSLFVENGRKNQFLDVNMSFLRQALAHKDQLYSIDGAIGSDQAKLAVTDPKTEKQTVLLNGKDHAGISSIVEYDADHLLVIKRNTRTVLLYNTKENKVEEDFDSKTDSPRTAARYGKCLIVGSQFSREIEFVDTKTWKTLGVWDLSGLDKELKMITSLAVDEASGRIYVRSSVPARFDEVDPADNAVFSVEEKSGEKSFMSECKAS